MSEALKEFQELDGRGAPESRVRGAARGHAPVRLQEHEDLEEPAGAHSSRLPEIHAIGWHVWAGRIDVSPPRRRGPNHLLPLPRLE